MRGMRGISYGLVVEASQRSANNNETTPNVPTPTRPPRSRVALASKDNNALIQTPTKTTKRGFIMPPPEKQQNHIRPLLSSATKQPSRSPLTPRIAGSTQTTPSLRRAPRSEANGTPSATQKDEYTLSGITPRSSSRRSRIESPNATPTGTPTPSAPVPRLADPPRGLGIGGLRTEDVKRPSVTFAPASEFKSQKDQSQNANSKFFYASDTKAATQTLPQRPNSQAKGSAFFYANGDSIPPVIKSSSSAVGSTRGDGRLSPMFFHANGGADIPSPLRSPTSSISTSRITSSRLAANPPHQRPTSPRKKASHSSIVSSRSTTASPIPPRPNVAAARGQSAQSVIHSRRVSHELRAHARPVSAAGSHEFTPPGRKASRSPEQNLPTTPSNFSSVVTVSTPEEGWEEKAEHGDIEENGLGSPIRAGGTLEQMNELAAEARRDRKVLDLEITNSSLEAINRTLERQMRKQNAELRRYRRLSRSGRLSLTSPTSAQDRNGDYPTMPGMDGADLSDMSEQDDEEDDEDKEGNSSEEESENDGSLSPSAMAESDARHRSKDEKRLRFELSKHQQLIADSQSMNSSLKRCLAWTEELITEGKKALAYSVRPSDIKVGGRVLISEDIEIDESEGLSEIGARLVREARQKRQASLSPSTSSFGGSHRGDAWADRTDRDSGIELPSNYRPDPSTFHNNTPMEHPPP